MRTPTGLTLIAIGAILAFAIRGHPSHLNIQVAGWVIMITGLAGMLIPPRRYGWLRRRMVLRRQPGGAVSSRVSEARYPPYIMLNPGSVEEHAPRWPNIGGLRPRRSANRPAPDAPTVPQAAAGQPGEPGKPERTGEVPAEEIVDEYIQE